MLEGVGAFAKQWVIVDTTCQKAGSFSMLLRLAKPHQVTSPATVQMGPSDAEAEFWRIVEQGGPAVQAVCALDLDTTKCGSGFPQASCLVMSRPLAPAPACASALAQGIQVVFTCCWPENPVFHLNLHISHFLALVTTPMGAMPDDKIGDCHVRLLATRFWFDNTCDHGHICSQAQQWVSSYATMANKRWLQELPAFENPSEW